jgi:phage nucleotide-binding protein
MMTVGEYEISTDQGPTLKGTLKQMKITNTKDVGAKYLNVLVHGPSGSGKTRLCATTGGKPLIISAESGLLSLRGLDLDVAEVKTMADLQEVYTMLTADTKYDWVCIDSISEVAEVVLSSEKGKTKDPRAAYGEMQNVMTMLIRSFRDLPKNVYMSAKQDKIKDEMTGGILFGPSAPGQKIPVALPYFFDEVFALHSWKDAEGKIQRAFQTQGDAQYVAKDRSGALDLAEPPDLGAIYKKIVNQKQGA